MFVAELRVFETIVAVDTDYHAAAFQEVFLVIRKVGDFERATGGVVARIKKQDDILLALESGQINGLHVRIREDN